MRAETDPLTRALRAMCRDGWARSHAHGSGETRYVVDIDGTEQFQQYEVDGDPEATRALYRATPGRYEVTIAHA